MFMVTKRLFLRPLWSEDAAILSARMGHAEVIRNLGTPPVPFTDERAAEKIAADLAAAPASISLGIFARADMRDLAGGISLGIRPDRDGDIALSYWIARDWWGRKVAVEAGHAVLEHAFLGRRMPLLKARVYTDNPQSAGVLERLGFERTGGIQKHYCVPRGCDVDTAEYRLTAERWFARAERRAAA